MNQPARTVLRTPSSRGLVEEALRVLPIGVRVVNDKGVTVFENDAMRDFRRTSTELDAELVDIAYGAVSRVHAWSAKRTHVLRSGHLLEAYPVGGPTSRCGSGYAIVVTPTVAADDGATLARRLGVPMRLAEVAMLVARGARNDEIAAELGITTHTARRHTERLLARFGVSSRAALGAVVWSLVR